MRIALVHDYLMQGMRGAERVLLALHRLYPQAPIYTLLYDPDSFGEQLPDWEIRTSFLQPFRQLHQKLFWLMPRAIESLELGEFDLIISCSSAWAKSAIPGPGATHLCYCHSPARFLWSWSEGYLDSLRAHRAAKLLVRRSLPRLREWDVRTAARVQRFAANSQTVQGRIRQYWGRDSQVIYPPVETSRFSVAESPDDYFLLVAKLNAYKRTDLAVAAFNELRLPLIVIGDGPELERLRAMAGPTVRLLGAVSDVEVAEQMARCRAFLMPQEEDFGIAAVEAQAAGRPVIAYRAGGARETVIEGETGLFFDEPTPSALAEAVRRFEGTTFSPERCRQNALRFDTERFVQEWREFAEQE